MRVNKYLLSLMLSIATVPAFAGWQNAGDYMDDGYYTDDGSRFVIGLRGGVSFANAKMKNDMGSLESGYYMNTTTGEVISDLRYYLAGNGSDIPGWVFAGTGDLSALPVKEKFAKTIFTAGGSIGFTIPHHSHWRLEAGYDHIAETNYNQIPLFEGDLNVSGGEIGNATVHVRSSGAKSSITTDVISAMAFYDFYEGRQKTVGQFVPYVGFGVGYAISKTKLHLTDIYGDLSLDSDLKNYGTPDSDNILQFDTPSDDDLPSSTNIAVLGSVGFAYGIAENTFIDAGVRLMYVPKITWQLVNSDATHHRDWFSAENMLYTNVMIGLRFEF